MIAYWYKPYIQRKGEKTKKTFCLSARLGLRAARNNIGCFSHIKKLANLRVKNTPFQSNTNFLIFCRGSHFVVPIGVTGVPDSLQ
jgi:hypothetical protein